jgi:hypothetical protein
MLKEVCFTFLLVHSIVQISEIASTISTSKENIFVFFTIMVRGISQLFASVLFGITQLRISQIFHETIEKMSHIFLPNRIPLLW